MLKALSLLALDDHSQNSRVGMSPRFSKQYTVPGLTRPGIFAPSESECPACRRRIGMRNGKKVIEVILFDLGNVILPYNHNQIAEKLSRFSQRKEFQDPQRIFSFLFYLKKGLINYFDVETLTS
jgi:hypothetical protein